VADEHLAHGIRGEAQAVLAVELMGELLDAELALAAQLQDQRLLALEHLALGRVMRAPAAILKAGLTLGLVTAPPLAQGRP
jgi:hypothetical protein